MIHQLLTLVYLSYHILLQAQFLLVVRREINRSMRPFLYKIPVSLLVIDLPSQSDIIIAYVDPTFKFVSKTQT